MMCPSEGIYKLYRKLCFGGAFVIPKRKEGEVMPKLTDKQKRFCEEYLIDLNATQAAIRAGYKNPEIGRQIITKNNVSEYLNSLMKKRSENTGVTAEKVVKELESIAFIETEITGKEKIKALELLGKHLGMFSEKKNEDISSESETPMLYKALEDDAE